MRKNPFNRYFICALVAITILIGVGLPHVDVYAAEAEETVTVKSATKTISAPETSVAYQSKRKKSLAGSSSTTSSVTLKSGNAEKWIDRVELEDYALDFYEALEDSISDADGMLIDVTQNSKIVQDSSGYKYPIVEIEGKTTSRAEIDTIMTDNFSKAGDNIAAAYYAFDRDHPEVFWLGGGLRYTYSGSIRGTSYSEYVYKQTIYIYLKDTSSNYDIRATGYQDADTILADIEERDQRVSAITAECKNISRYKTIKALNSWLTKNNGYNTIVAKKATGTAPDSAWECISALEGKSGTEGPVCEGYARAFKVLCDALKIPCVLVDGQAKTYASDTAGSHMWNYVQMEDGNWYGIDVTWNDPVYSDGSSGNGTEDYFLVGEKTVNRYNYSFANSHVVYNMPNSKLAYTNGPVLSDEKYVASGILGARVTPETVVVTYGYSQEDAPLLTVESEMAAGVTDTPTYQWYLVDDSGNETKIPDAVNENYIVPTGKAAGTYKYVVKAMLDNATITSDEVSITVEPYTVTAEDLEFVDDEQSFEKTYDGTTFSPAQVQIKANTFGNEDAILVEGSAEYNDASVPDANSITFKPTEVTTGNYRLSSTIQITHTGTITKSKPSAPALPMTENITSDSITLKAVEGCEYSLQTDNGEWSENLIYTGLSAGTTYTFFQRYKETENTEASDCVSASFTTSALDLSNNATTSNVSDDIDNNDSDENKSANAGNGGGDTGTTSAGNGSGDTGTTGTGTGSGDTGTIGTGTGSGDTGATGVGTGSGDTGTTGTGTGSKDIGTTGVGTGSGDTGTTGTGTGSKDTDTAGAGNGLASNSGANITDTTDTSTNTSKPDVAPLKGEIITDDKSKAEYKVTKADGKILTVTYVRPCSNKITTVSLPKTITVGGITYKVTAIADNAFKNCKKLKKITIGGNVITIGKNVFNGDKKLKTIVIKTNQLTSKSVSKKAFAGVSSKVTIKVSKSKVKTYTRLFRSKGLSRKVKVKK
jgi:hypothetical protein